MKNKILNIFVCIMLVLTTIVFSSPNDLKVMAASGEGVEDEGNVGLDYDFIYEVIEELSQIALNEDYAPDYGIWKGRNFGTPGERFAKERVKNWFLQNSDNLSVNIFTESIGNESYGNENDMMRLVNNQLDITSYNLEFREGTTGDPVVIIPNNESFPFNVWTDNEDYENFSTGEYYELIRDPAMSFYNIDPGTVKICSNPENITKYDVFQTLFNSTQSVESGELTYIEDYDNTSAEEKEEKLHLINVSDCEFNDTITMLEECNASGFVLIRDDFSSMENWQTNISGIVISEENGSMAINLTKNGTVFCSSQDADITSNSEIVYLIHQEDDYPICSKKIYVINASTAMENWGDFLNRNWFAYQCGVFCAGFIIYDDSYSQTHFQYPSAGFSGLNLFRYKHSFSRLLLPTFAINGSVIVDGQLVDFGEWIDSEEVYGNFWVNLSKNHDVESYNVICDITVDGCDEWVVFSGGHHEGWWGQSTIDDAAGIGQMFGIFKYFNDNNITPKCNLRFISHGGHEAGVRGSLSHVFNESNWPVLENASMIINIDQIGHHFENASFRINTTDYSWIPVLWKISEDAMYNETFQDKNYWVKIGKEHTEDFGAVDAKIYSFDYRKDNYFGFGFDNLEGIDLDYIEFCKDNFPVYHRTGYNHTLGDTLDVIDQDDLNATADIIWNVTKYFTVDPDCWWDSINYTFFDSEDEGDFNDSIRVNITAKTILPHDRLMANVTLRRVNDSSVQNVSIKVFTLNSSGKNISLIVTLPENKKPGEYFMHLDLLNSTGIIDFTLNLSGNFENQSISSISDFLWPYNYNLTVPDFTNVNVSPDTVGYGFNVSISADVSTDANCSINDVTINIIYPNNSLYIFDMNNSVNDTYTFVFNDSWYYGQYQFYIWADDEYGNESGTPIYSFNVDAEASITICTIKDEYGGDEIVNLTDPPGNPYKVGYEFLDDGKVLHIWNRFDSYYFNTSNGIQFTNHKDNYWSTNVLMLGYYNNDIWNLIYRTDELSGFNKNIISDNKSYVNATLWKDLTYNGYEFQLAIRYILGVDDNELTVIPYIKNIDDEDITYNLGFAWELKDIQIDITTSGDYIEINGTSYFLNQTLDETYTILDIPCFYIKEDKTINTFESLYLRWDKNLNYKVKVESREGQYNAPVTLGIKIGTLNVGLEKYTNLYWHDASEIIYYFDDYNVAEAWASNPSYMVDGNEGNYASTSFSEDTERCDNNTCNGTYLGNISKVEIRCKGYREDSPNDIILLPIYNGVTQGDNCYFSPNGSSDWSQWYNLPGDDSSYPIWDWYKVKNLDCVVNANFTRESFTLFCSKVEIRVTYTPKTASGITNPIPADGSTGISIAPTLSINVSDADGDNMTITWYSNSSGTWQIFGTNSSVGNGTYQQEFSNASVNGQWWYWNISVDDGEVVNSSDTFSFYTGCESKIYNSGDTNISGYLSMIVEYYNSTSEDWEIEMGVIDKSYVVINSGEKLGLDTIFNPENVNTSSFTHGNGTYRVYAMLTDPNGNILFDGTLGFVERADDLKAWYEFTVTYD